MLSTVGSAKPEAAPTAVSNGSRSVVGAAAHYGRRADCVLGHWPRPASIAAACASGLGLSTFVVGLITGSQFAASLISRVWAGRFSDVRGAKRAVTTGLFTAAISGLLYVASLAFVGTQLLSVSILLLGRALLGGAESFIITGAVTWGLVLAGPANAGRVIAWMGMAMFAALAFGAPIGIELYSFGGFLGVAVATTLVPLITFILLVPIKPVAPQRGSRLGS